MPFDQTGKPSVILLPHSGPDTSAHEFNSTIARNLLLYADRIEDVPENAFDMSAYKDCGTPSCIAGWLCFWDGQDLSVKFGLCDCDIPAAAAVVLGYKKYRIRFESIKTEPLYWLFHPWCYAERIAEERGLDSYSLSNVFANGHADYMRGYSRGRAAEVMRYMAHTGFPDWRIGCELEAEIPDSMRYKELTQRRYVTIAG